MTRPPIILVITSRASLLRRLCDELGYRAIVHGAASSADIDAAVERFIPAAIVIDGRCADRVAVTIAIAWARTDRGTSIPIAVITAGPVSEPPDHELLDSYGLSTLLYENEPTLGTTVLAILREHPDHPFVIRTARYVASRLPIATYPMLDVMIMSQFRVGTVKEVAAALARHPTTLQRELRTNGIEPWWVIDFCKTVAAVHLLLGSGLSANRIARLIGFESGRSLRALFARMGVAEPTYVKQRQREISAEHFVDTVVCAPSRHLAVHTHAGEQQW